MLLWEYKKSELLKLCLYMWDWKRNCANSIMQTYKFSTNLTFKSKCLLKIAYIVSIQNKLHINTKNTITI